jgi:uncharacterized protein
MRSPRHATKPDMRSTSRLMTLLTGLFGCRVLGQVLVATDRAAVLPSMEQWQSGLLPYPVLLTCQIVILTVQGTIDVQAFRGRGRLVAPRPRLGRVLGVVSCIYGAGMAVRYVLTMRRHPEWRWFGHTIPIWFHCVLATYLNLYARLLKAPAGGRSSGGHG